MNYIRILFIFLLKAKGPISFIVIYSICLNVLFILEKYGSFNLQNKIKIIQIKKC